MIVFGAGALGMGFLGPEFQGEYRIAFADIDIKADVLDSARRRKAYRVNVRGAAPKCLIVGNVTSFNMSRAEDAPGILDWLRESAIAFTAVGEPNLPKLAATLAPALKGWPQGRRLAILCSENGMDIAKKMTSALEKELGGTIPAGVTIGDTTMGRMCQWLGDAEEADGAETLTDDLRAAVVVEPFHGIPCLAEVLDGIENPGEALEPMTRAEFEREEDIKLLAHNGLHFFLATLGYLKGFEYFSDLPKDRELMGLALRMMEEEVGRAILKKHRAVLRRCEFENYAATILRRITCPNLKDAISRGVRGAYRKLHPGERVMVGAETILAAGAEPKLYLLSLPAALEVTKRMEVVDVPIERALAEQCRIVKGSRLWDLAIQAEGRLKGIL